MTIPHNHKLTIAIDGPAAAGKSSVSKLLAQRLGYAYVDTGIMYRALAWAALQQNIVPVQKDIVAQLVNDNKLAFRPQGEQFKVFSGDEDITGKLRTPEISQYSSTYSALPAVRKYLVKLQRELGEEGGVVMEGRDIGTVVFPEADYKFFLSACPKERGRRRFVELKDNGNQVALGSTVKELENRDKQDSERNLAPLCQAPDAIAIDSTRLTIEQVVDEMLQVITEGHNS
jgi:cytidylate kinase